MNYSFSLTMEAICNTAVPRLRRGGGGGGATKQKLCNANLPKFETHRNS
jgi:hypothetical protein